MRKIHEVFRLKFACVISSLKTEGHRIAGVSREGSVFLLEVEKTDEG